ncbi:uncharacterized protein APUU_40001S [Aspergillus puulaauensis]|uniref:Uncharacterized protein n=1 Tax=Aspergillus puulaauensis TaxID=1220207 RepID=A0A7R7XL83_9EURO|nr:uncharacterized protein APUU_40001S [Aspergillus puulaauensis]BCS23557.1 hypothetical protein APUU_40001S [Aspergillus puulaauensis]
MQAVPSKVTPAPDAEQKGDDVSPEKEEKDPEAGDRVDVLPDGTDSQLGDLISNPLLGLPYHRGCNCG